MSGLTLGSLFDGSGGFPLAGYINGIEPLWASEIEPFPIRVTTKRFPNMKHYGDVSKLNGAELPSVDIITFGSPCTNLSTAGRREGLDGEQSALFFEAVRIIKEMRSATNGTKPRFIVWENVPGAYTSGGGFDFARVLDEIVKIKNDGLSIPMPSRKKWLQSGEIVGDGFSVAWRTIDAQYFGVAQRRRRCYLVADFAEECAADVLFERESVSWNITPRESEGQETAENAESGVGTADANITAGTVYPDMARTLTSRHDSSPCLDRGQNVVVYDARGNGNGAVTNTITGDHNSRVSDYTSIAVTPTAFAMCAGNSNSMKSGNPNSGIYEMETARTLDTTSGASGNGGTFVVEPQKSVYCLEGNGSRPSHWGNGINEDVAFTLNTVEKHAIAYDCRNYAVNDEISGTLQAKNSGGHSDNYINPVVYALDRAAYNQGQNAQFDISIQDDGTAQTVLAKGPGAVSAESCEYAVRRLTPLECCRLQGFPDFWCAGLETPYPTNEEVSRWWRVFETHRKIMGTSATPKNRRAVIKWLKNPYSDAAEYKMWGNGICLQCGVFVLAGIVILSSKNGGDID